MSECIFCNIASGDIPASKVYEDSEFLAFLDINPSNKGHTLIMPKAHVETLIGLKPDQLTKLMSISQKVAKGVLKSLRCDGFNLLINNKPAAQQEIPHIHVHIIPRYETDDFKIGWTHKSYDEGEINKVADDIKRYIS